MLNAYKKLVLEKKIDEKVFHFTFDENSSLGALYQAADEFRSFVVGQITDQESPKEEVKKEEDNVDEQQPESSSST